MGTLLRMEEISREGNAIIVGTVRGHFKLNIVTKPAILKSSNGLPYCKSLRHKKHQQDIEDTYFHGDEKNKEHSQEVGKAVSNSTGQRL